MSTPWMRAARCGFGSALTLGLLLIGATTSRAQDGPSSVLQQAKSDRESIQLDRTQGATQWLEQELHLVAGADYNINFQYAGDGPGPNTATGGVARVYAHWTPLRLETAVGSLVVKGEHRHRIGTDVAPQELGPAAGYAGLTSIVFSDAGALLTNFYWSQCLFGERLAFVAGTVDPTDYLDVYGLVNPWADFNNLAFSTNPTIPVPNQGLGFAFRLSLIEQIYLLGGIADANAAPHDPVESFETFFGDGEHFRHLELGWIGSWENRFADNVHITAWQADRRDDADVDEGWGIAVSVSRQLGRWNPFLRAGYSDGGGALLDRTVSAGVALRTDRHDDTIGIGASWGRPPTSSTDGATRDQFTLESYYRLQIVPHVTLTPDLQVIVEPAFDPGNDVVGIFGFRLRVAI